MNTSTNLHVLRSKRANAVMGTGSIAFGFKRVDISQNVKVWYTAIKPDKFVLTTAPRPIITAFTNGGYLGTPNYAAYDSFDLECVSSKDFLTEMLNCNLTVRIIEHINIENDFYTLYSDFGYEPFYTNDDMVIMLERQMML